MYLVGGAIAVAAAAVMLPGLRALRAEQSAAAAAEAIGEVE